MNMKIFSGIICALLMFAGSTCALAQKPRAYFAYNTFLSPDNGPYIETYFQLDASSLKFIENSEGDFQATVEILLIFKQNEVIKDFSKYELKSPAIDDTTQNAFSFIDQQRFLLPDGDYMLEILLSDINRENSTLDHIENINVDFSNQEITISSIQLADRIEVADQTSPLTKSGYDIYPYVDSFYPSDNNTLLFYTEIYNAASHLGNDEGFLIVSSIEAFETRQILPDYNRFKRDKARPVNALLNSFDITSLPSGNFFLVVKVVNRNNETLASNRVFFQRSNPQLQLSSSDFQHVDISNSFAEHIVDPDSLSYFVRALGPISSYIESEFAYNLAATGNIGNMQKYFYNFWLQRDPAQPAEAWKNYYIEMCRADANFRTQVKRGYATDRGRVYLQYGTPNSINKSYDEPAAYPYEIWHYYSINGQRNRRFVFYTHDITTNDFDLIHSDMIGEIYNPRWMTVVNSRRDAWELDFDSDPSRPWNRTWGSRIHDYYHEPR